MSDGPADDFGRPLTIWGVLALVSLEMRDALGYKCAVNGGDCTGLAVSSVLWPGREPVHQCQGHYDYTLRIADMFGMEELIRLGARPLDVKRRLVEPEDATEARFAAMELT